MGGFHGETCGNCNALQSWDMPHRLKRPRWGGGRIATRSIPPPQPRPCFYNGYTPDTRGISLCRIGARAASRRPHRGNPPDTSCQCWGVPLSSQTCHPLRSPSVCQGRQSRGKKGHVTPLRGVTWPCQTPSRRLSGPIVGTPPAHQPRGLFLRVTSPSGL